MPLQATSGAASYDAFGGGVPVVPAYIEEVFSTFLYKGNSSAQTITNGIDLSGKGGLLWCKGRDIAEHNNLFDTARGNGYIIRSNNTQASDGPFFGQTFTSSGFTLNTTDNQINSSSNNYVSWTFRKQPKFFDVVTYTGNSASNRAISHSLGSTPGCIIFKCTSSAGNWKVWHNTQSFMADLDSTAGFNQSFSSIGFVSTNSTTFTVTGASDINTNGETYVAYLFAHDAGGFGLTGTDNVISCGSYTGNASANGPTITLGYEPQWLLVKNATTSSTYWYVIDNMRGMALTGNGNSLNPNLADAENFWPNNFVNINSTGFKLVDSDSDVNGSGQTYIYIAIRRGPMKVPTVGTSVFGLSARTGTGANATVTGGQTDDAVLVKNRGSAVASLFSSRLTGKGYLVTSTSAAEVAAGTTILQANPWDVMDGVKVGTTSTITNASSNTYINYLFKRAPSFMDVACYTGTGSARTVAHNLTVVPELIFVKSRSAANGGLVYNKTITASKYLELFFTGENDFNAQGPDAGAFNSTEPTSSVFTVGTFSNVNANAATYVAYLFATCAGVSKVGTYTGTATTLQIDCGFTAGARFILIKRTDDFGDWYVWDTARGIVSGNDPYLLLSSTAAEVTSTDYIDTYSAGFEISSTAPAAINASGGTFIFLAIA